MILDGKSLSEQMKQEMKKKMKNDLVRPCLAVIQIGSLGATDIYIHAKEKACNEVGIYFKHILFDETATTLEITNKIIELNNDDYVDGILLQLPIPEKYNVDQFLNLIHPNKDVDGLTNLNFGKLSKGKNHLVPCTPLGIIHLLEHYQIPIAGKHAVIVGRSNLVGKPLALLLLQKDATVTICHSKTENLKEITKQADILISAVGKEKLITADMVKKDSIVIDVGMNRNQGKLCGDVDFENVFKKVSYITPVPGGVGPMTVVTLLQNVVDNHEKKLNKINR